MKSMELKDIASTSLLIIALMIIMFQAHLLGEVNGECYVKCKNLKTMEVKAR